jgi:hypothetical protein
MRDGVDSIWRGAWQDMIYPLGVCSRQRRGAAADAAASSWWRCDHGGSVFLENGGVDMRRRTEIPWKGLGITARCLSFGHFRNQSVQVLDRA